MSIEVPRPTDSFGLSDQERLYNQVSDTRFRQFLADEQTTIHSIELSTNNYGEFLFVTVSREHEGQREAITFWGAGFHEYRERWITQTWEWYRASSSLKALKEQLTKAEAAELLQERRSDIAPYAVNQPQSHRARLFEILADLTDEDGAYSELEDMGDMDDGFDERS